MEGIGGQSGLTVRKGNAVKRLNIGCGNKRLPGYVGVDVVAREACDLVAPADSIPLPDASVDEVLSVHLVEHVHRWELPRLLAEWARLLKPEGRLVIECPDLLKCCENVVSGLKKPGKHPDQMGVFGLFGDYRLEDPYMMHKFLYTFESLSELVVAAGFKECRRETPVFHGTGRYARDMRLEALRA